MATHETRETSSTESVPAVVDEKEVPTHVEQIHTNERVPGHPGYYEKDGLRTYGDDEDHDHEPPVCSLASLCIRTSLTNQTDDHFSSIELGVHGVSLDWLASPSLCRSLPTRVHLSRASRYWSRLTTSDAFRQFLSVLVLTKR